MSPCCRLVAWVALCIGYVAVPVFAPVGAQAEEAISAGVVPVKVIAGHLIARCDVSTPKRRIAVNLLVQLDNPCGLALHNNVCNRDGLDADRNNWPITLHFPGFTIPNQWREKGPEALYGEITKVHSPALGEVPLAGTIGAGLLKHYHLTLDLPGRTLTLAPPAARDEEEAQPIPGSHLTPASIHGGLVWLPVVCADGTTRRLALGTSTPLGRIEPEVARTLRTSSASAIGPLRIGDVDLATRVALRPAEIAERHPDGVLGVSGLALLEHLRVEIDRVNGRVRLRPTGEPSTRQEDAAFLDALDAAGTEALAAYLAAYKEEGRHLAAAAEAALDRALEAGTEDMDTWRTILTAYVKSRPEDRRATLLTGVMKDLASWELFDAARLAGELGIEEGREDKDPNAVHKIHATLGGWLLDRDDREGAWKHLLSAAFGLPEDGRVNLNLGRLYERQGRLARAFSRYVQALIAPDSGPAALEALERVQAKVPAGERFGVELVERAIAGKGSDFAAPDTYKPTDAHQPKRCVLAELFTNAGPRGTIAADLAFNGLRTHFPTEHVVCVTHHLLTPAVEPLASGTSMARARDMRGAGATALALDGKVVGGGGGKARKAEAYYRKHKELVEAALLESSEYTLEGTAAIAGDVVEGSLTVGGPDAHGLVVRVWLVEAGVVYPGNNRVVIHRNVCRGEVVRSAVPEAQDERKPVSFRFSLNKMAKEVDRFLASQRWRGTMLGWKTRVDPVQARLVAFVERAADRRVLQTLYISPDGPEDE